MSYSVTIRQEAEQDLASHFNYYLYSYGLTSEVEAVFLRHCVSMFLSDIKEHEEVQAVFAEYWEYFG